MVFLNCFIPTTVDSPRKRKSPEKCVDEAPEKRVKLNDHPDEKISLSHLPNEILLQIFKHLDSKSLLNAVSVNKNWKNLILETNQTMQKIGQLFVDDRKVDNEIPKLTRKYDAIQFQDVTEWKPELIEQLILIGKHIKEAVFIECVFFDDEFQSILGTCFPNLKFLEIIHCYRGLAPSELSPLEFNKVQMNNLHTLVIKGCSWMLSKISTPKLNRFEVQSLMLFDQETLMSFLNDQRELKILHLVDIRELFDSRYGSLNPQFNLKEIVMINLPLADGLQTKKFLRHMQESVEYVDFGREVVPYITEYMLLNFKNIVHLKIDYECLPTSSTFYYKMDTNKNLKFLAMYGNVRSSRHILKFIQKLPQLEDLILSELYGLHPQKYKFWEHFSHILPNLKTLAVRRLNIYNMMFMKLKNLTHLDVDYIGYSTENAWRDFCKNNSNIETFHIFGKYQEYFNGIRTVIEKNLARLKEFLISN